jgi:hypothetical protein
VGEFGALGEASALLEILNVETYIICLKFSASCAYDLWVVRR